MKVRLFLIAFVVTFLMAGYSSPAMADSIQLQCGTCTTGSVTQMFSASTVQFSFVDVANQTITGNAFVAILVPTGGAAPTLTDETLVATASFTSGDLGNFTWSEPQCLQLLQLSERQRHRGWESCRLVSQYDEYSVGKGVTLGPNGTGVSGLTATVSEGSVIVGFIDPPATTYQTPLSGQHQGP